MLQTCVSSNCVGAVKSFLFNETCRANLKEICKMSRHILNLTFRWPCIVIDSCNKNLLDALISQIYFWNKTLHVSDSSSVHHQEFFSVNTAMVYVIQVCLQLASRIRTEPVPSWSRLSSNLILLASCQQTCMTYTIAVCAVKNSWWCTTCRVLLQKEIWVISASSWFYFKNVLNVPLVRT